MIVRAATARAQLRWPVGPTSFQRRRVLRRLVPDALYELVLGSPSAGAGARRRVCCKRYRGLAEARQRDNRTSCLRRSLPAGRSSPSKRAAELETRELATDREAQDEELTVTDLVRLGEEAGLGRTPSCAPLGELRRGALRPEEADALSRALGPSRLIVSREVPGTPRLGPARGRRFLREQLMTVRRHHGDRIEWERAQGLWPGLARSLDFASRYAFGPVSRVETLIVPETDSTTSVTFDIDMTEMRRHRLGRVAARPAPPSRLVGWAAIAIFPGFGINDVIALFSGGALAGSFAALERRRYQQARERVALAPNASSTCWCSGASAACSAASRPPAAKRTATRARSVERAAVDQLLPSRQSTVDS